MKVKKQNNLVPRNSLLLTNHRINCLVLSSSSSGRIVRELITKSKVSLTWLREHIGCTYSPLCFLCWIASGRPQSHPVLSGSTGTRRVRSVGASICLHFHFYLHLQRRVLSAAQMSLNWTGPVVPSLHLAKVHKWVPGAKTLTSLRYDLDKVDSRRGCRVLQLTNRSSSMTK